MLEIFLTFLPLIMVTVVLGFGCVLVIDSARRQSSKSAKAKSHHH
jgi:hypothetical protein